jgi:hypothetical protein
MLGNTLNVQVAACCVVRVLLCREYPDLAEQDSSSSSSGGAPRFKLALHCGGCMIDAQKMRARIADMEDAGECLLTTFPMHTCIVMFSMATCILKWAFDSTPKAVSAGNTYVELHLLVSASIACCFAPFSRLLLSKLLQLHSCTFTMPCCCCPCLCWCQTCSMLLLLQLLQLLLLLLQVCL